MKLHAQTIAGMLLTAASVTSPNTAHAAIIISSNLVSTNVRNVTSSGDVDSYNANTPPVSHLLDATAGGFFSRIQVDYSQSASGATLSNNLTQRRDGVWGAWAIGYDNSMLFTVDATTTYDISGSYSVIAVSDAGVVYLHSYLHDISANTVLFDSYQESRSAANATFALGGAAGDYDGHLIGSSTGTLIAGRRYSWYWYWYALTKAHDVADGGASADGNITLKLGDGGIVSTVPEPRTLAIWSLLGGIGMLVGHRRHRRNAAWKR